MTNPLNRSKEFLRGKVDGPFWVIVLLFILSRLVVFTFGVTYDDSEVSWFYQFLDIELLKHDLGTSLWHLHSQPPLLNLLAGLGLKMPPPIGWWFWNVLYLLLGMGQVLLLFDGLKRLGTWPWIAVGFVSVYMVSPAVLLFENLFFYPYPSAALLIFCAWLLIRHLQNPDRLGLFIFFLVCALLPLLRSIFHLVWIVAVVMIVAIGCSLTWRKTLLVAIIPLLLVTGWYTKNLLLFNSFSGSSWMGMNFARATVFRLPDQTREDWIEEGILSEISRIGPFSPIENYEGIIEKPPITGVACLDNPAKSETISNFNHIAWIDVSKRYETDAWTTVRLDPVRWIGNVADGFLIYFRPTQEFALRSANQSAIEGWEKFYDRWITWQVSESRLNDAVEDRLSFLERLKSCSWMWILLHFGSCFYGIYQVMIGMKGATEARNRAVVYAFLTFNIVYIAMVGNMFEYGENNRFRFMADPLVLLITGSAICDRKKFLGKLKTRRLNINRHASVQTNHAPD